MKEVSFPLLDGWTLTVRGTEPAFEPMVVLLRRGDEVISRSSNLGTSEAHSIKALQTSMESAGGTVRHWHAAGGASR